MSCQTSKRVPILSISKICEEVMTFCLNVLPEALGQDKGLGQLSLRVDRKSSLTSVVSWLVMHHPTVTPAAAEVPDGRKARVQQLKTRP